MVAVCVEPQARGEARDEQRCGGGPRVLATAPDGWSTGTQWPPAMTSPRLGQVTYDQQGRIQYPRHHDRAPESELRRYLHEARTLLAAATPASVEPVDALVSADFEQLRWFDLPPMCLADSIT